MDRFLIRYKRVNDKTDDESNKRHKSTPPTTLDATPKTGSENTEKSKTEKKVNVSVAEEQPVDVTVPRAYQRWKQDNPWLALNNRHLMICTICTEATKEKLVINFSSNDNHSRETWIEKGFSNWKHGPERIKIHAKTSLHIHCAEALKNRGTVNVLQHLSTAQHKQMMNHRTALRKVFSTLRVLGKQGLAIRGAKNDESSNFMTILKARAEDVKELETWLQRTGHKWLHHDIQNEILEAMAKEVMLRNLEEIKNAEYYSILLDETSDIAKTEQISIYIRVVSLDLLASEYFVGFYSTANTKGEALFEIVKDVLLRLGLPLSKLRGQCYDGAANVSGKISGLQQRIREEEPRALFVHCNAHNLNLVVQDGIEKVLPARKFIGEVKDLINFVRDSPKRLAKFKDLQDESVDDVPALAAYCPTRWVVRIKSLKTVLANYKVLMNFFEELSQDPDVDSTVAAKASGFLQRMESFEFLFFLYSMIQIFDRIEVLNTDLQQSELCVVDSFRKVEAVTLVLESSRDSKFDKIWLDSNKSAQELDVEEPNLPRKRRNHKTDNDNVFKSPEKYFKKMYCEVYDQVYCSLKSRFGTDAVTFFKTLEKFVIGDAVEVKIVAEFYKGDFDAYRLDSDKDMALSILKRKGINPANLREVVNFFRENEWCKGLVPEYVRFIRLLMTIPGSSCSNERSFSVLRRVKNYMRSTMLQNRLNHIAILHSYPEIVDEIDIEKLMDNFIRSNTKRLAVFALRP